LASTPRPGELFQGVAHSLIYRYRFRIDDTPEEYVAEARRHPLFELRRPPGSSAGETSDHH